jgi:hypothetical protein
MKATIKLCLTMIVGIMLITLYSHPVSSAPGCVIAPDSFWDGSCQAGAACQGDNCNHGEIETLVLEGGYQYCYVGSFWLEGYGGCVWAETEVDYEEICCGLLLER